MNNSKFLKIVTMVLLSVGLSMLFIGVVGCIASYADFVGLPDEANSTALPTCSTWIDGEWYTYSMAPFVMSQYYIDMVRNSSGVSRLLYQDCNMISGHNTYYFSLIYQFIDLESNGYFLEASSNPEDVFSTRTLLEFPIMNNYRDRSIRIGVIPGTTYFDYIIYARGYNYNGTELVWDNFEFTVSINETSEFVDGRAVCYLSFPELESYDFVSYEVDFESNAFDIQIPFDNDYSPLFVPRDQIVDVTVVPEPNFLEWVTRSVSAFLNTPIFTIGAVRVTIGVCFLVPLSLYILVAFLKKFSGG